MWDYQMFHLTNEGLRCISYDRRGHGRSDDPGRGCDYDTFADDLSALIDTLTFVKLRLWVTRWAVAGLSDI
ncbi:alpha/beta fold hydrolase [Cytobacillus dafuensis]|uniref:alpha/beta fold hydrolase n=1 Tax=Cytobacillus dafuensis TaxID=1742359 RepID=UPI0016279663